MFFFQHVFLKSWLFKSSFRRLRALTAISSIVCVFLFLPSDNGFPEGTQSLSGLSVPESFPHRFQSGACQEELKITRILLVVRIHADLSDTRKYIREKIQSSSECMLSVIFLYGKFLDGQANKWQNIINNESKIHGDILQFPFLPNSYLNGQRAVETVSMWLTAHWNTCFVYQQVAFAEFRLPREAAFIRENWILRKGEKTEKEGIQWSGPKLETCLQFGFVFKRTNLTYFAHYYPPPVSNEVAVRISQKTSQSLMFRYQEAIISPHWYPYLIEPSTSHKAACGTERSIRLVLAVIAVHSSVTSFESRKMIRSTWAHPSNLARHNMFVLFFLGRNESCSPEEAAQLKQESETHNDVVQVDFLDTYKNMTLKQISVLKYLTEKCSSLRYRYLFKTDDDVVLNLQSITRYMSTVLKSGRNPQRTIFCFHMNEVANIPRYNPADKWFVSETEYPDDLYPAYCSGAGYLITKDLVSVLYNASLHVNTFWVDDTYVSGMLPQAVGNVTIIQIPNQSLVRVTTFPSVDISQKMIVHVKQDLQLFQMYWKKLQLSNSSV